MLLHPSEKEMQQLSGGTIPRLVTVSQSLVVTSEWELLLSQPHSPSQHSLPITHCTLHACILLSAAGHMTALLSGRNLVWLVGSFAGDAPHSTYPLQSGSHNGGGEHLTLCSPWTTPTRVDQSGAHMRARRADSFNVEAYD